MPIWVPQLPSHYRACDK